MKTSESPFTFERTKVRIRSLDSERDDGDYWLTQSLERRVEAVEFLRAGFVGEQYASQRLPRILRVTQQA